MGLHLHNTLSKKKECFTPLLEKQVRLYCCGPTVHDFAHIGNFRTFVLSDLLTRYLRFRGYKVMYVMNITDVEDKIVRLVKKANVRLQDHTLKYEDAFFKDMKDLNCLKPDSIPRVSDCIDDIIILIERLIKRGLAYETSDGSVYFSIRKYMNAGYVYGQLMNMNFDQMQIGERCKNYTYEKEELNDFALWKTSVSEDGNVFWDSPWGRGRPGWHIECSAMSMKFLGASFDIHIGGEDLIFPHHEDEIAQSEGAAFQEKGMHFVKYWIHVSHLLIEGKKMSKSLGNFYTLKDLLHLGFRGRELRFVLLSSHYREGFNFTLKGLHDARIALGRIDACIMKLKDHAKDIIAEYDHRLINAFISALDDDLNLSLAWSVIFDWVREMNRRMIDQSLNAFEAAANLCAWKKIEEAIGIQAETEPPPPAEILSLIEKRQVARQKKDFISADEIRRKLLKKGWMIEDTPKGPRAKRA